MALLALATGVAGFFVHSSLPPPPPERVAVVAPPPTPIPVPEPPRAPPLPLPVGARPAPPLPPPAPPRAVAVLTGAGAAAPVFKLSIDAAGEVAVTALRPVQVPANRQLGLWALPPGLAAPVRLARLDGAGGTARYPYDVADGTRLMVTLDGVGAGAAQRGATLLQGVLATVGP